MNNLREVSKEEVIQQVAEHMQAQAEAALYQVELDKAAEANKQLKLEKELKDAETPTGLPVGLTEFEAWASDIIRLAQAPDNDSCRFALATMIMQLPASTYMVPKRTLVDMLRKGMSNQVASAVYYELKKKQEAEEKAKKELEASKTSEDQNGNQK